MIDAIKDALGLELREAAPIGAGQGRTFRCRLGDKQVVAKWGLDSDLAEKIPYVAGQLYEVGRRGAPVPAILAHGRLGGPGYAWVQQHLAGTPATRLDSTLLSDLIELIHRWAGAPAGDHRSDYTVWVPAVVFDDDAGWWASARAAGPEVAAFCRRLRRWVGEPTTASSRHDYVHEDLNLSNVLIVDGRLAGVVDLENLGAGNSSVDVARLLYEWHRLARTGAADLAPDGHDLLAALGRDLGGDAGWRQAIAYELIGRLGWRSEHDSQVDLAGVLPVCVDVLDALR